MMSINLGLPDVWGEVVIIIGFWVLMGFFVPCLSAYGILAPNQGSNLCPQ